MADTFARMRQLIGTTAEWGTNDIVIGLGEFAIEKLGGGAVRMKLGDGVAKFSQLPYFDPGVFDFVLKGGDTMTGPLIVPGVTIPGGGLQVQGGASAFAAPVNLGAGATAADPPTSDDTQKVPTTHWVNMQVGGIITGLSIKGTWNAATNTPALASGGLGVPTPERGDFYIVSVAGTTTLDGISTWNQGDSVVFNGFAWQRVPQTLGHDQIVAGLGYTPANDAELDTLDANAIKRQLADAAGDLIVGTANDTVARLPRGSDGQVLRSSPSGIVWATPASRELYSQAIAAAGSPIELVLAVPVGARSIVLEWELITPTDTVFALQIRNLSGHIATAQYTVQSMYGGSSGSGAASQYLTAQTYWGIGGSSSNAIGSARGQLSNSGRSDNVMLVSTFSCMGAAPARQTILQHMDYYFGALNMRQTITGFRFSAGAGFVAGSAVRCFATP